MKKTLPNIFLLIIALILFAGLAPRFLLLDEVQKKVTQIIGKSLGNPLIISNMNWVWLPLPHLTLTDTRISNTYYDLSLPRVNIFPSWRIILGETEKPGKILLDSPKIRIHESAFQPEKASVDSTEAGFPDIPVTIKNGKLELEFSEDYKDILHTGSLTFSNIRGNLKLLPLEVQIDIHTAAPFSKNINLKGGFNISEKTYRFSLDSRDLKLHKSVKAFLRGNLVPVDSTARLSGTVTGTGLQHIEGNLLGTLPCFVVKPQDREVLLTCGFADLKFLKKGPLMRLDINDLEIKDPQVNLSGHIERKLSAANTDEAFAVPEPVWNLDFVGGDLDLTAIRQKILTLWPENKVAVTVCNIVRSGKALSAAYRFSGRTEDFQNLDAMYIEADALNADIHVPKAALDLTNASGPIQIKDSVLTGHSLSAQLGDSYGRNAELFLDLGGQRNRFKLDIDIDADLKDLPPILARLVKHDGFQQELAKFAEVTGSASGTVHLGDNLNKIITRVNVREMEFSASYARIPQKVEIDSGSLDIDPDRVSWQKTKGRIGRQEITNTSGNVSWLSGEPSLDIIEAMAQLDGASLLTLLKQTEVLPQQISKVLSSVTGAVEVTRGSVRGPARAPLDWEYDFNLAAADLAFTSPLLPEPSRAEQISATINHEEASIQPAKIHFLEQTFSLKGLLKHRHFENWHGMIEFNGPLKSRLAGWIASKGWFPARLHPKIPCTLKNMKVNWQENTVAVSGNILQGVAGGTLPMASIDYENTPGRLRINELAFFAPGEQGRLKLDFWRHSPKKLILTWEGFVSADSIDALFKQSFLSTGALSGDLEIQYFTGQPEKTRFVGLLKTENLTLKTKRNDKPIIISKLDMTGIGRQLTIPALDIAIGSEIINGSGQIMAEKEVLQLDITVASSFLSKESLARLSASVHDSLNIFINPEVQEPGLQLSREWNIIGRIGFDFDSFIYDRKTKIPYEGTQSVTYTFYDISGDLQLAPDKISRTEIFAARLCGLGFNGYWFSDPNLGQKFQFFTQQDETLRLENVLPCLGVQQDIIEGEFSLQANLLKESNTWYGGTLYLRSSQGRILRLKTLSRIFKLVNITELFEEQVESTGKRGFPYSQMDIDMHIHDNNLIIDRTIIWGEGLNLFTRGEIKLTDYEADLSLLIAPFKTFDTIISKVPIIGEPVMGEYGSRITIPVAIKGPITHPVITPMHPEAIGREFFNIVRDTFLLPYNIILKPLEKAGENTGSETPD